MALHEMKFSFQAEGETVSIPKQWSHTGVVGSGDMEVLIRHKELKGEAEFKVVTPVIGFDNIWEKVLKKFVNDTRVGNVFVEINDNNSTPFIASMRLKQALIEAQEGGE